MCYCVNYTEFAVCVIERWESVNAQLYLFMMFVFYVLFCVIFIIGTMLWLFTAHKE